MVVVLVGYKLFVVVEYMYTHLRKNKMNIQSMKNHNMKTLHMKNILNIQKNMRNSSHMMMNHSSLGSMKMLNYWQYLNSMKDRLYQNSTKGKWCLNCMKGTMYQNSTKGKWCLNCMKGTMYQNSMKGKWCLNCMKGTMYQNSMKDTPVPSLHPEQQQKRSAPALLQKRCI